MLAPLMLVQPSQEIFQGKIQLSSPAAEFLPMVALPRSVISRLIGRIPGDRKPWRDWVWGYRFSSLWRGNRSRFMVHAYLVCRQGATSRLSVHLHFSRCEPGGADAHKACIPPCLVHRSFCCCLRGIGWWGAVVGTCSNEVGTCRSWKWVFAPYSCPFVDCKQRGIRKHRTILNLEPLRCHKMRRAVYIRGGESSHSCAAWRSNCWKPLAPELPPDSALHSHLGSNTSSQDNF
jgi:hypothetical protein